VNYADDLAVLNPKKKYNYDYYMGLVDKIVGMGAHILGTDLHSFFNTTIC
jgi:pyruvate carboxylase